MQRIIFEQDKSELDTESDGKTGKEFSAVFRPRQWNATSPTAKEKEEGCKKGETG